MKNIFRSELFKITFGIFSLWFIAAFFVLIVEISQNNQMFANLSDALWWSIVSITTTGYGDKYPITQLGRIFASISLISGVVLFSMLTATISSIFIERKMKARQGLRPTKLKNHIAICGWNSHVEEILKIFSLYSKNKKFSVVLVNDSNPEKMQSIIETYSNLEIEYVNGDYTIETILNHANIKFAEYVLVVPNLNPLNNTLSDDKTLHATLAIKNISQNIKVFVHLINAENYSHVKRANADDVILSDQYVGMMLANNVIFPGATQVTLELLDFEKGNDIHRVEIPSNFIGKTFETLMNHFKKTNNWTVIAIIKNEEKMSLSDMITSSGTGIDNFIERKFKEAGIDVGERSGIKLNINPTLDYVIKENEFAIIIGSAEHLKKV